MKYFSVMLSSILFCLGVQSVAMTPEPSNCWSAAAAQKELETAGGKNVAELKYEVSKGCYGQNCYWRTVSAYKYEMPDGVLKIATCDGVLTRNLKKGPLKLNGTWYHMECPFGATYPCEKKPVPMDHQNWGAQEIEVLDYNLDNFGHEQVWYQASFMTPIYSPRMSLVVSNGLLTARGQELKDTDHPVSMNVDQSGNIVGLSAQVDQMDSTYHDTPIDTYLFMLKSEASQDQTPVAEIREEAGRVTVSPTVIEYPAGQALSVRVVNNTQYNIELTGAQVRTTFLKPTQGSKADSAIVTLGGPSLIKINLPWSSETYLELKKK